MQSDPTTIAARAKSLEQAMHAARRFGQPDAPSRASGVPTIYIRHPVNEQKWFDGRVNIATAPETGEQQYVPAPANVVRVYHTTLREERIVSRDEAFRLCKHGWHVMGVVDAKPAPVKPIGRL